MIGVAQGRNRRTWTYQTFTTSTTWSVPTGVGGINVLLVGGGGSGGAYSYSMGGGGGGGIKRIRRLAVTPGETVTITIGAGGLAGSTYGADGGTTSIQILTGTYSVAGGAGGQSRNAPANGGAGKGGYAWGGAFNGGTGDGYHRAGGNGYQASSGYAWLFQGNGGGGSAWFIGSSGSSRSGTWTGYEYVGVSGNGQAGANFQANEPAYSTISVESGYTAYLGGGGGGAGAYVPTSFTTLQNYEIVNGSGGSGGGGAGGYGPAGTAGTANTGGGGGGGGLNAAVFYTQRYYVYNVGGNGGSGLVMIEWQAPA